MRPSGRKLFDAFARGATDAGADVVDIGMVSTDALYFAVGKFDFDGGVMITASHNPAQYNGMKFTRAQAQAISLDTGLAKIREQLASGELPPKAERTGTIAQRDVLDDFAGTAYRSSIARRSSRSRSRSTPATAWPARRFRTSSSSLPLRGGSALLRARRQLSESSREPDRAREHGRSAGAVRKHGCDLGVAFDGDADRMFIVDEKAGLIDGSTVTALVALNTLKKYPGAKILYNLICSRSVPELIREGRRDPGALEGRTLDHQGR